MNQQPQEPALTTPSQRDSSKSRMRVRTGLRAGEDKKKKQQDFLVVTLENVLIS